MSDYVPAQLCNRLKGGSIKDCVCRLPNSGGWLPCPPDAEGELVLVPDDSPPGPISHPRGLSVGAAASDFRTTVSKLVSAYNNHTHGASVLEKPRVETTAVAHKQVKASLSGDICDDCGSPNVQRAGTCLVCRDCGSMSGGCG